VSTVHISREQIVVSKEAQKQFDQLGQVYRERLARKLFSGQLPTKSIQFPTSLKVVETREGDYRLLFGKRDSDVILIAISRRDQLQSDIDQISKKESFRTTPLLESSIGTVYAKVGQPQVVAMVESELNQDTVGTQSESDVHKSSTVVAGESDLRFHLYKSFDLLLTQMQNFETSRDESQTWSTMLVEGHEDFVLQLSSLYNDVASLGQRLDVDTKQSTELRQETNEQLAKLAREMQLGKNRLDQINQKLADSGELTTASQAALAEQFSSFSQHCTSKIDQQRSKMSKEITGVLEQCRVLQSQFRDNRSEVDRMTHRLERLEEHFATAAAKSVSLQSSVQRIQQTSTEALEQERSRADALVGRLGKAFDDRIRSQQLRVEHMEAGFDSDTVSLRDRLVAVEAQLADQRQMTEELQRQTRELSWLHWLRKCCSRVFRFGSKGEQ
jgi:hypothetical protein